MAVVLHLQDGETLVTFRAAYPIPPPMTSLRKLKLLATGLILLTSTLTSLHATKVAGGIDANNGLVLNLLPDPTGRPAAVVVSNTAGTQFITESNSGLQIQSYNSAPSGPQPMGNLSGAGALPDVLGQVLTFQDANTGQQVTVAINQSRTTGATTIASLQGKVTLNLPGNQTLKIDVGNGAVVDNKGSGNTQTLAQIIQNEKLAGNGQSAMAGYIRQAVEQVAADVASGAVSGAEAAKELAAIVRVAAQADPAQAATFVSAAVAAISQNSSISPQAAISAVVTAATEGNEGLRSTVMAAASSAAESKGFSYSAADLTASQSAVDTIFNQTATTPVSLDITVISVSN